MFLKDTYAVTNNHRHSVAGQSAHTPLHAAIDAFETPATRGGSFRGIFSPALQLGVLSPRRAHVDALPLLRLADAMSPSRVNTCRQAMEGTLAWDFFSQQARQQPTGPSCLPPRHWRWDGVLTEYVCASGGGGDPAQRPAVLLVHGFGAFAEQWRGQVAALADAGLDVYAATFPGYGRSEKPPLRYGQDLWRDFLRDFILEVVGRPVVIAGNSIGGFISASLAADYPSLVHGIVLINSAGPIVPDCAPPAGNTAARRAPPTVVVDAVSWALFSFLERSITRQLARLYPTAPQRADSWLATEIFRAACDPGALGVFRSVFYLPPPRALNYLLDTSRKPVLVFQGALDPLNDARGRAAALKNACRVADVQVELVEAGHCPMDEVPDTFNASMLRFVQRVVDARVMA